MNKKKPRGYWSSPENILKEAKNIIKRNKLEKLPNKEELAKRGHSSLAAAITRAYPDKYAGLRIDLGESVDRKEYGYWSKPKNVEREIKTVMREYKLKTVPSGKFLREINRSELSAAISSKYPGGYHAIREKFGDGKIKKSARFWHDVDNIKRVAKKIIKEYGYLPGKGELYKKGYSSFSTSVVMYHGGFRKFRELIGEDQKKVGNGYWKDPKNIEREVRRIKKKEGFKFLPPQKVLSELGYSYLSSAISSFYPGGFSGYRKSNNDFTPNKRREKGYWTKDILIETAKKIYEEKGYFPSEKELKRGEYASLPTIACKYLGGLANLRLIVEGDVRSESLLEKYVGEENDY